jgi:hypothetical protein
MTAAFLFAMFSIFVTLYISKVSEAQRVRAFREDLLLFKLKTVQRYYPELNSLNYFEIAQNYDLDEIYYTIPIIKRR